MDIHILTIIYLIASVTFILGLKMLSHPDSARRGNLIAAAGMSLAIFGTIFLYRDEEGNPLGNYLWIFAGLIIGGVVGTLAAKKVKMTAMPEMVSLFNGMGGACAMFISVLEWMHIIDTSANYPASGDQPAFYIQHADVSHMHIFIIVLAMIIGAVSFAGSMIAWGKLNGKVKDFSFKGQQYVNLILLVALVAYIVYFSYITPASITEFSFSAVTEGGQLARSGFWQTHVYLFYGIIALALVYGVMFVLPIGGADMPVVISLLNSFTGVAAACGGFLYNNQVMLTGGILVGAAGTLLTILMCKAMNRSLMNVLLGSFGGSTAASSSESAFGGHTKEINLNDAAVVMSYASKVVIVPGYGLAVAQAQHVCHELENLLADKGVQVTYAIHPVAGRMPGHMNVLLAEADVSYEKLLEMEQANDDFKNTDVVLILGANDVVNPAAKTDPASPIYGMPILEVEQAKMVIVNKRSMKPGYAGIENQLFFQPKTSMLFGDAKGVLQKLVAEIKEL
ncbi:MAG TPA: NAD(P)(+) transhydrogenase (Re/Si-specific) subunit beta [Segetibacter sp.]|jgi:NAD(P) transhydrogenase subunit beta